MVDLNHFLNHLSILNRLNPKGKNGFSLIEILAATFILSIGILGVMQMGLLAAKSITSGDIVTHAVLLAQGELEEIRAQQSLVILRSTYMSESERQGYFLVSYDFVDPLAEEADDSFSINCGTSDYDGSGTCQVKVTVAWKRGGGGRGGKGEVMLKTMLGEAC